MPRQKIYFRRNMDQPDIPGLDMDRMSLEEQEKIWQLSRIADVFIEDINGTFWQVLDCGTDEDPIK